jgi:sortase A
MMFEDTATKRDVEPMRADTETVAKSRDGDGSPVPHRKTKRFRIEHLFLIVGALALSFYVVARFGGELSSRIALYRFYHSPTVDAQNEQALQEQHALATKQDGDVDFSLWSEKRIQAYRTSLLAKTDLPVAVLRIPKIHLEVPVFDGTDDMTLDRGVGRIIGTAKAGQPGNIGIAGHRDGFFRGLKDVGQRDVVELAIGDRTIRYVVQETTIVQPEDVSVLATTKEPTLTLVTCFPFYFVGSAPQRFIVRAASSDFDAVAR